MAPGFVHPVSVCGSSAPSEEAGGPQAGLRLQEEAAGPGPRGGDPTGPWRSLRKARSWLREACSTF